MPLRHLIDCFNDRFAAENRFDAPPLTFDGHRVEGRSGGSTFTSRLQPVRLGTVPSFVAGYDASTEVVGRPETTRRLFGDDPQDVVTLDRLIRTVHMLNYLLLVQDEGYLFLQVHPRHVLTVKQDHGAYFEEIIRNCGLSPQRVVITLAVGPTHAPQLPLLLERLRNYRGRGYATALQFDTGDGFLDRYGIELFWRFPPDFVRFDCRLWAQPAARGGGERRRESTLAAIRRLDTRLLVEGVQSDADAELSRLLRADLVKGDWYERSRLQRPRTAYSR
ncbi:hypothetical protein [Candidatus Methylocalor cossyra]|uniref:EAL domain, c-di-GMP-specific phosphodiesterase class I (Or its enzymatically inactive variant) n=1 Tax=Candidatus Methylocalor cossyra TaxID=3108543 RepID=A0ABM9NMB4_9GAMM